MRRPGGGGILDLQAKDKAGQLRKADNVQVSLSVISSSVVGATGKQKCAVDAGP